MTNSPQTPTKPSQPPTPLTPKKGLSERLTMNIGKNNKLTKRWVHFCKKGKVTGKSVHFSSISSVR